MCQKVPVKKGCICLGNGSEGVVRPTARRLASTCPQIPRNFHSQRIAAFSGHRRGSSLHRGRASSWNSPMQDSERALVRVDSIQIRASRSEHSIPETRRLPSWLMKLPEYAAVKCSTARRLRRTPNPIQESSVAVKVCAPICQYAYA